MVKIYHRPDPPPPDVDSNRAVRKTETFLNREASSGLFLKALAKAQGQEHAVERSKQSGVGQQHQIESDSVDGAKTRESVQALHTETKDSPPKDSPLNAEQNAVKAEDKTELQATADDSIDEVDANNTEQDEQDTESALSTSETSAGPDANAAYQMFENIRDLRSSSEPQPRNDADSANASENVNNEKETVITAHAAVAHSAASTTASLQSRVDSMSSMSDLIDMLETSSQLPVGNEWTLLLDDDGPVSELKLSSDSEGRWNIDLLTSFNNEAVDDDMISNLRHQLDTAGVAVANISLVDAATTESPSAQ